MIYSIIDVKCGNLLGFIDNEEVYITKTKINDGICEVISKINKNLVGYTTLDNLRKV